MAVIRLIRHGQASFGLKDYDQLSELGFEQARLLGRSLRRRVPEVDRVICGGMERHRQTAETALEAMGIDLEIEVDPRWNEYDHEDLVARFKPAYRSKTVMIADLTRKGDPRRQFQLMFEQALARWTAGGEGYAESFADFRERVGSGLVEISESSERAGDVLVFTSGGPVSAATAGLLGVQAEGWLKLNRTCANCSETKIVAGRSGLSVVTWNAHPWFDADRELLSYR
jgi:broad specificity phosphatase PhoE